MDIIRNNPYRVLGVLANASRKEIERNKSQIKAFAKVGKTPSFPYDFENILGPVDRSEDNLNDTVSKLTFDKDKVAYGLFWFNNASFVDEETLRRLKESSLDYAVNYLANCGLASYSAYINMVVISLLSSNWICAAYCYTRLFETENIWNQYVHSITKNSSSLSMDEIIDTLADNLINFFPSTNWLTTFQNTSFKISDRTIVCGDKLKTSKLYSVFSTKYVSIINNEIDSLLVEAKGINYTDANKNLNMATKLEQSCRELLASLKSTIEDDDSTYIHYADKVALQTLNNCIAYYNNDQRNPNCAKNVLRLMRFCVRISEGKIVKDKCKNNFEIIKEAYNNMCPQEIFEDVSYIKEQLSTFDKSNSNYLFARLKRLIDNINSRLINIKQKVGESEKFYYALSKQTIYFAFNIIIPIINEVIEAYDKANYSAANVALFNLQSTLNQCKPIIDSLEKTPKKDLNIALYYADNYRKFYELYSAYTKAGKVRNNYSNSSNYQQSPYNYSRKSKLSSSEKEDLNGFVKWLIGITVVLLIAGFIFLCIKISNAPQPKRPFQSINCNTTPPSYLRTNDDTYNSSAETTQETEPYDVTDFNTGDMPYRDIYGKGKYDKRTKNYLEIDNGGETDAVVFLETLDGRKIRHAYICKNEKFKMKHIPGGKYIIKIMQGNFWNAQKDDGGPIGGFMKDVSYSKSEDYDPFAYPSYSSGKWGWYSITLYKTENGNMSTQMISKDEIF